MYQKFIYLERIGLKT